LVLLITKWLPGRAVTEDNMVKALALEEDYWERQQAATQVAIAKAWKGDK
jgi:hypothetical protein